MNSERNTLGLPGLRPARQPMIFGEWAIGKTAGELDGGDLGADPT
jgi:hypothetical protein